MKTRIGNTIHESFGIVNIAGVVAALTDADLEKVKTKNNCEYHTQREKQRQAFFAKQFNCLK